MVQEDAGVSPQNGVLLRRAHDLLESLGQPAAEDVLIRHLFGASGDGNHAFWTALLRQTLTSSSLFEPIDDPDLANNRLWSLKAWRAIRQALDEAEFVVLDTETTGLRPLADRVIEVAAVRLRAGEIVASFQSLINPARHVPPFITRFTGISQEMVNGAPRAKDVFPDLLQFIEGATLVGHNVSFDINFLTQEAYRLGLTFPPDGFDTILLARRFLPGLKRFKLDTVAEHLKIPTSNRHRAMGDVKVTAAIFLRIMEIARQQGFATLGHLQRRLQLPVAWSGDITEEASTRRTEPWSADDKISVPPTRPTGSLFLNPAWRQEFPSKPGVYLMKDANGQVIYVGKAKCLKDRLGSYYSQPLGYAHHKMNGLLPNVHEIETRVLGSELEALLVESRLIKELQPAYNVQLRDYELYPFIKIDIQHTYPRVYATREVAADGARYFGPFRSRRMVDVTIELVQKIFPIRTCTRGLPPQSKPSEPCLRLHLNRCSAPCRGDVDPVAYRIVIDQICAFLGGEREDLLERLRRQMFEASRQMNFERAAWLRDAIHSAEEFLIGQRLITGAIEANNLFIIYPSAQEQSDEIFLIRHGRLIEQRCVVHEQQAIEVAIHELLSRAAELGEPPAIVGKAEVDQINIISRWIHRHSDDRAFFPFQPALSDAQEKQALVQRIWNEIDTVRLSPALAAEEDEDDFATEL